MGPITELLNRVLRWTRLYIMIWTHNEHTVPLEDIMLKRNLLRFTTDNLLQYTLRTNVCGHT